MKRQVNSGEHICLFCGQSKKEKWEEYEKYWECDCEDAEMDRKIEEEIGQLERKRPKIKYEIVNLNFVIKK